MKEMSLEQLLDEPRLAELEVYRRRSFLAPQRFVAWTPGRQLLVIMDLDGGDIKRTQIAPMPWEQAESVIRQMLGEKPY